MDDLMSELAWIAVKLLESNDDGDVQFAAGGILDRIGLAAALPLLRRAFKNGKIHPAHVGSTLQVLRALGDRGDLSLLLEILEGGNQDARTMALSALGELAEDSPEITNRAVPFLKDNDPRVRYQALYTLVDLDGLRADHLQRLLDDPDRSVRATAAYLGARLASEDPALQKRLGALLGDPEPCVRNSAAYTLGTIFKPPWWTTGFPGSLHNQELPYVPAAQDWWRARQKEPLK